MGPALLREGDADARAVLARPADRMPSPAAAVCRELITPRLDVACSTP